MRPVKLMAVAMVALLALVSFSAPASAHGRWRGGVNLSFGLPFAYWGPRFYGPPPVYYTPPSYYYSAAPAYAPPAPTTYVERDDPPPAEAAPAQPVWWYWCESARGYYPYVKECPGGWRRVPPQQ